MAPADGPSLPKIQLRLSQLLVGSFEQHEGVHAYSRSIDNRTFRLTRPGAELLEQLFRQSGKEAPGSVRLDLVEEEPGRPDKISTFVLAEGLLFRLSYETNQKASTEPLDISGISEDMLEFINRLADEFQPPPSTPELRWTKPRPGDEPPWDGGSPEDPYGRF